MFESIRLFILIGIVNFNVYSSLCNISPVELSVLEDLFISTNGYDWVWQENAGEHWNFTTPNPNPCHPPWQGIICSQSLNTSNTNVCNVVTIDLDDYNLEGTIPNSIGNLTRLSYLNLNYNALEGTIPASIGYLSEINIIELVVNELTGSIPDSFVLANNTLAYLYLYVNHLTGHLPPSLFNASVFSYVEINVNHFTGPLPDISLPNLVYMDLSQNALSGTIASTIDQSKSLYILYLYSNALSGLIPSSLGNLPILSQIGFETNQFTGTAPQLWTTSMIDLNLCGNHLTGSILDSLVPLTEIQSLVVCYNVFTGTVPEEFNQFNALIDILLDYNLFSGTITLNGLPALVYLYLQNNEFSGSISYTPVDIQSLGYVDFSSNQFTGELPKSLFTTTMPIISLAFNENCFSGSLPQEMCNLKNLVFLGLNGLSTASSCRTRIFPSISDFKSFYLTNEMQEGIPDCLFAMNEMETLLISGNSIKWSIPTDLRISDSLTQLSLSHNKIYGSIPSVIQTREWTLLDLSYNRLNGVIQSDNNFTNNISLTLQVNRLSGGIPVNLKNAASINILSGNLFGCTWNRQSLPEHDRAYKDYPCGSNTFDQSMTLFVVCGGSVLICFAFAWVCKYQSWACCEPWNDVWLLMELCSKSLKYFKNLDSAHPLHSFYHFLYDCCRAVCAVTALILMILLPLYGVLKVYFGTIQHQYAWTVSVAFLSGITPAVMLFVVYMFSINGFAVRLNLSHATILKQTRHITAGKEVVSFIVIVILNCILMISVNAAYVGIILNYNSSIAFVAQISISLFKLIWNDFGIRSLFTLSRMIFFANDKLLHHQNDDVRILQEMPYLTVIALFNIIVAPCLATAVIDQNCFYNTFIAPAAVNNNLPVIGTTYNCQQEIRANNSVIEVCGNMTYYESYISVSYDPPYIYSYQCSSSILTNYAAVYVLMFLIVTVIKPVMLCLLTRWYSRLPLQSCAHIALKAVLYNLLKPVEDIDSNNRILFSKDRFVLRMISKLTVLLTFGIVFPPLAVIVAIAFVSECVLHIVLIARFLETLTNEDDRQKYTNIIVENTAGCADLLLLAVMRLVFPLSALFLSFFVFDIYGDQTGFQEAIWAPVLLIVSPFLVQIILVYQRHYRVKEISTEVKVEMKVVNPILLT